LSKDGPSGPDRILSEAARIRNLSAECREAGIILEDIPKELETICELVHERRPDEALARIRAVKLDLLARLLLRERPTAPPARAENASGSSLPSDTVLSALNDRAAKDAPPQAGPRPPS
jgi:hypothetical protein